MSSSGSDVGDDSSQFLNPDFMDVLGARQRALRVKTQDIMFGVKVEPGQRVAAYEDDEEPSCVRLTMAAIDGADESTKASTLRIIRRPRMDEEDEEDEEITEEELASAEDTFVLCTLKSGQIYQQTLDLTFTEDEEVFFTVSGDIPVYLTGNYMISTNEVPENDEDFEDEEEDSMDDDSGLLDELAEEDDEEDELDEIDARIVELEAAEKPSKKSKKRAASADLDLDELMDEDTAAPAAAAPVPEKKLSKKERKKLKANSGEAVAAASATPTKSDTETAEDSAKKSVSFSKDTKPAPKALESGVTVEDRKAGEGPSVKSGSKVSIRYVGKLKNGQQFDANTKGKPFSFVVGKGECIKGLEIGIVGLKAGGERRISIPAAAAYGSKKLPGIPANSDLTFDVKLLNIK